VGDIGLDRWDVPRRQDPLGPQPLLMPRLKVVEYEPRLLPFWLVSWRRI
jgi:hypothetical protein